MKAYGTSLRMQRRKNHHHSCLRPSRRKGRSVRILVARSSPSAHLRVQDSQSIRRIALRIHVRRLQSHEAHRAIALSIRRHLHNQLDQAQ